MTNWQRLITGGVLFATWGAAVAFNKAPIEPFISAIQAALIGLGVYHLSNSPKE